jgi:hypothetical protein
VKDIKSLVLGRSCMTKVSLHSTKEQKEFSLESIKKFLSENHAAYVLITCSEPSQEGNMDVEMSYEGDESLTAYLLESARHILDNPKSQEKDSSESL